jgi:choline-sulfatase
MHFGGDRQFCGFDERPYGDITGTTGHQFEPLFQSPPDFNARKGAGKEYASEYQKPNALEPIITEAGVTEIPESLLQEYNVVRESLSFLREHRHDRPAQPWFLCASFSRPHPPFTAPKRHLDSYWPDEGSEPPVGFEGDTTDHPLTEYVREQFNLPRIDERELQKVRAAYFACITFLDEILADMMTSLQRDGLLENTIVIYASDHGEMAGEHGLWGKRIWQEASTRVPWFVQLPGHRTCSLSPGSITTPVSLADLFPTLCGLCDVSVPMDLDGVDLSENILTGNEPDRDPIVCDLLESGGGGRYRMVRGGQYKYVHFEDHDNLLFDLPNDPLETENILQETGQSSNDRITHLVGFVEASVDFAEYEQRRKIDEQQTQHNDLPISRGHGNAYLMDDGRLVDADTPLYRPYVLARYPSKVFEDWPEE